MICHFLTSHSTSNIVSGLLVPDGELHVPFEWTGMTWDLFLRRSNDGVLGIFVGFYSREARQGLNMKLAVKFRLIDANDKEQASGPCKGKILYYDAFALCSFSFLISL